MLLASRYLFFLYTYHYYYTSYIYTLYDKIPYLSLVLDLKQGITVIKFTLFLDRVYFVNCY